MLSGAAERCAGSRGRAALLRAASDQRLGGVKGASHVAVSEVSGQGDVSVSLCEEGELGGLRAARRVSP